MTAEEQITRLEEQLTQVLEQLRLKDEQLQVAQAQLRVAQARIEELEKQKTPPPPFVKANVVKPQAAGKKQRKKRDAKHNHGRRREAPTRTVDHLSAACHTNASQRTCTYWTVLDEVLVWHAADR